MARSTGLIVSWALNSRTPSRPNGDFMLSLPIHVARLKAGMTGWSALARFGATAGRAATGAAHTSAATIVAAWPGLMVNVPEAAKIRVSEGAEAQKHCRRVWGWGMLHVPSVESRLPVRLRHSRGTPTASGNCPPLVVFPAMVMPRLPGVARYFIPKKPGAAANGAEKMLGGNCQVGSLKSVL